MVNQNKLIKEGTVAKKATTSKKSNQADTSATTTSSVVGTSNNKKNKKKNKKDNNDYKEDNASDSHSNPSSIDNHSTNDPVEVYKDIHGDEIGDNPNYELEEDLRNKKAFQMANRSQEEIDGLVDYSESPEPVVQRVSKVRSASKLKVSRDFLQESIHIMQTKSLGWLYNNQSPFIEEVPEWCMAEIGDKNSALETKKKLHYALNEIRSRNLILFQEQINYLDRTSIQDIDNALNKVELELEFQLNPDMYKNKSSDTPTTPYYTIPKKTTNHSSNEREEVENIHNKDIINNLYPHETNVGEGINLSGRKRRENFDDDIPTTNNKLYDSFISMNNQTGVTIVNSRDMNSVIVRGTLTPTLMIKVVDAIENELRAGRPPNLSSYFTSEALAFLSEEFFSRELIKSTDVYSKNWINTWKWDFFIDTLRKIYKHDEDYQQIDQLVLYKRAIDHAAESWCLDASNIKKLEETLHTPLRRMYADYGEPSQVDCIILFARVQSHLKRNKGPSADYIHTELDRSLKQEVAPKWLVLAGLIKRIIRTIEAQQATSIKMGLTTYKPNTSSTKTEKKGKYDAKSTTTTSKSSNNTNNHSKDTTSKKGEIFTQVCRGCGSNRHRVSVCDRTKHPDYNTDHTKEWTETKQYKTLIEKGRNPWLHFSYKVDGTKIDPLPKQSNNKKNSSNKGNNLLCNLNLINNMSTNDNILISNFISTGDNKLSLSSLIDSGATQANYCSEKVASWVKKCQKQDTFKHKCKLNLKDSQVTNISVLANSYTTIISNEIVSFDFIFCNELTKNFETIPCLKFNVIKSNIDLIVGLPTIRKFKLASKLPSVFEGERGLNHDLSICGKSCNTVSLGFMPEPNLCSNQWCSISTNESLMNTICGECANTSIGTVNTVDSKFCKEGETCYTFGSRKGLSNNDGYVKSGVSRSFVQQLSTVTMSDACCDNGRIEAVHVIARGKPTTIHRRDFLGEPIKDDEIVDKEHPIDFLNRAEIQSPDELLDLIHIEGSEELQKQLRALCKEYKDIFSTTVRGRPANLPEMNIDVNDQEWKNGRNRLPPRHHGPEKQAEILKQLKMLIDLDIIEISTASEWSQVHMVPKPASPGEWRLTIDFVKLNECTIGLEGWPITIIAALLRRLGAKKHVFFGVLDMTSGYFQGPLAPGSRSHSAFITLYGLYQWKRVPMGMKGSGPYFQRAISSSVLAGLIYDICELYIDDVLISGASEESFLANVRTVFQRFRDFGVVIHPKKAKLGMKELEYVGHLIDKNGLHFSKKKRLEVLNFPKPVTQKHVNMFLGLVNYFRDHVNHITELLLPLREMIEDYHRHKKVVWTPQREEAFTKAKQVVYDCQKLFFVDENAIPILQTDASDYGIGGMLYQVINEIM